jgi:hypothetical protein
MPLCLTLWFSPDQCGSFVDFLLPTTQLLEVNDAALKSFYIRQSGMTFEAIHDTLTEKQDNRA